MRHWLGHLWRFAFIMLLGFSGSLIAGLMKYGADIFDPQSPGFSYFIVFGLTTSLIFAFYNVWGLSDTIVAALAASTTLFILLAIFARFWMPLIHSAFWSFGVNLSVVVIAFLFERKLAYFKQWKFIVIGIIFGAVFVFLTFIVGVITRVSAMPADLFQKIFLDGMLLGLGLGIGAEIGEAIVHSVDLHRQARRTP